MNVYFLDDGQSLWPFVRDRVLSELTSRGHEVLPRQDAQALLDLLRNSHEPSVTVIGPELHGLKGMEWVRRVRASECAVRPHLLLALDDDGARAVIEALQAGADDCLPAPWQPDVFAARALAAVRLATHQRQLLDEIKQRDHVLSQMVSPLKGENKETAASIIAEAPPAAPANVKATNGASVKHDPKQILAEIMPAEGVEQLVAETLFSMGFSESEPEIRPDRSLENPFSLVHFLILPGKTLWLDLLLEADRPSSRKLFEAFSGMDAEGAADSDFMDALGETLNLIQAALKARFKAAKYDILTPIVPQYVPPDKLPPGIHQSIYSRHLYAMGDIELRFTLYVHGRPVTKKPLKALTLGDVLVEPLRPDEESDLVIINKGTLLAGRYLEKAAGVAENAPQKLYQPIVEPSLLGLAVCKK
ncbi:hypothetical protein NXS98_10945 [Fontisphaera persica]|uniref:hypothetical protein n=1 Tax=Fontisphaera persica TaxID=2974023 RepID=UPI0024BFA3F0|nr:hypothetical protein [Fontisphaera persica]WCJ58242.1 hypothetical protein NXS98_10945 [Fontisphaera persica]